MAFNSRELDAITSDNEKFFMLTRNYYPKDFTNKSNRYKELSVYGDDELRAIQLCHGLDIGDSSIYNTTPNALENFVAAFHNNVVANQPIQQIAEKLGMYIPVYVDPYVYFLDNVAQYKNIFERNKLTQIPILSLDHPETITIENMQWYTDFELMNQLKALTAFTSRTDMFLKFINLINTPMFFIPLVDRKCMNKDNKTPAEGDIISSNMNDLIISYGMYKSYSCLTAYDLVYFFDYQSEELGGRFKFTNPFARTESTDTSFNIDNIKQLALLLQEYTDKPDVNAALNQIDIGLRAFTALSESDRGRIGQFDAFSQSTKQLMHNWLMQLFYTGMYMRQWEGPPNLYPMLAEQTNRCDNYDPQLHYKVGQELHLLYETENKLGEPNTQFLRTLQTVEYNEDRPQIKSENINYYIRAVADGKYCIRMGSTKFIGTAYYYLSIFFPRTTIPDFDIRHLVQIS